MKEPSSQIPGEEKHHEITTKKKIVKSFNFEFCICETSCETVGQSFKPLQVAWLSHQTSLMKLLGGSD